MSDKLKILFLCTGNSCRSQMAEGWAHHLKGDVIDAHSAGNWIGSLRPEGTQTSNPIAIGLVNVSLWLKKKWFSNDPSELEKVGGCATGKLAPIEAKETR